MKKCLSLLLTLAFLLTLVLIPVQMPVAAEEEEAEAADQEAEEKDTEEAEDSEEAEEAEEEVEWDGTPAEFHIGVVTGTVSQSEDDLRGAEELIKRYGASEDGGMITHITYPDNFTSEQETTISQIVGLADDPDLKAIVVNQAVPGTAAAFQEIREFRDDVILIAGEAHDDPNVIDPVSDLVVGADNVNRGYLIPYAAKELGAKTFVHVSFPRHMSYQMLSLRRSIMKMACQKLGLEFVDETAPDPTSEIGIPGAQQFILEHMDDWVENYGKDTVFFTTNDAQTEPMLKKVAELGAMFIEADLPSPLMGYPAALDIDLKEEAGDWPAILEKVESVVSETEGNGRMGTWAYSYGFTLTAAIGEFAKGVVEGKYEKDEDGLYKIPDVVECFQKFTPGANWNATFYTDTAPEEPVLHDNHLLIYQDTYILGKGFMGQTEVEVPEWVYFMTNDDAKNEEIIMDFE